MESSISGESLSGIGVLNDYSHELYYDTMILYEPMISGRNLLKTIRKSHAIRTLDKIINVPTKEQEKIIDILTDAVSTKYDSNYKKFQKQIDEQLSKISEIKKQLTLAETYFNNLTSAQRRQVIHLSIMKLLGGITTLRKEINYRIWKKDSNIEELLIVDQVLYRLEEKLGGIEFKHVGRDFSYCLLLLLRLEAYRMKKINFNELKDDLSTELFEVAHIVPDYYYVAPNEYKTVLEVLGKK